MKFLLNLACVAILCTACADQGVEEKPAPQQSTENSEPWLVWGMAQPDWVKPAEPFTVLGNIHYVGTKGLGSYLITTDEGHILIDGAMPQSAGLIADNIETLGFDIKDVNILLNSHAHFDHSGGLAELKEKSGAQLIAHKGDVSALEGGFYLGFEDNESLTAPPVNVDRVVVDGDRVELGDVVLTANLTPGHTRGCTSWSLSIEENGNSYETLLFCSATVAGNTLVPEQYEGIIADYRSTFEKTSAWRPDILLAFHDQFFDLWEKRALQMEGNRLAFVDRDTFPALINSQKTSFEKSLAKQQAANE